ncbi:hypothetical protein DL765_002118 [Monosporascus sp. GIB2]|nr:hypothetical protein DL765_002118 [Monosporascus sp. GIB2]
MTTSRVKRLTLRALLVVTELRGAGGLTLEAYKNILSLLGLDEDGFPLTNGATAKPMDHQACLTNGQVNTMRETTAEGYSAVEGHEPATTAATSTGTGADTANGTAATNFIGNAADTTAGITVGTTAFTSTGTAADTTACTAAGAGANSTGTSDDKNATVAGTTDPSQEPTPCAPVAVVCEQTGSPTMKPAISLDEAKNLLAVARQSRREETVRNLEIRKAMANDSMSKREPADPVLVDEEADKIRKLEYLESRKSFSPSDRHHLAKPGELVLVASGLHDLVQTPDGDIVWRQSAELFRRAESMPHERARPSFDKHFTKCDEEGNLMVDDHGHPVVIQETMLKNTELSKRKGAETVVAHKTETRQDHRLKKDGEVIIRWTENEIAVLKPNGDRVIRRAPEQFIRSYNLVNPAAPEKADDLEYRTCDAEGYQLKDAYGREAVLAETLRIVGPSTGAGKPRAKRTTASGKGLKASMHNRKIWG